MLFEGRASNWALTKLEIENLGMEVKFPARDDHGHDGDHDHDELMMMMVMKMIRILALA